MFRLYAQRKSNTFSVVLLNESFFKLFSDYLQNYTRRTCNVRRAAEITVCSHVAFHITYFKAPFIIHQIPTKLLVH
jgi:hypothetical protein